MTMSLEEFIKIQPIKNEIVEAIESERTDFDYKKASFDELWDTFIYATKSDDLMLPEEFIDVLKNNFDSEVCQNIHGILNMINLFLNENSTIDYEYELSVLSFEVLAVFDSKNHSEERKLIIEIIKKLDYQKYEALTENLIGTLSANENGVFDLFEYISSSYNLGEKETTILSYICNSGVKNEDLYKFLRSSCKNEENEPIIEIILNCVQDYGDVRAVSYLRTLAKKYYDKIEELALKNENVQKYRDIFYMILGVVEELGGNVEM